jgi:hypothetical protein
MSDLELIDAVAHVTGEDAHEIRRRGFVLTGPEDSGSNPRAGATARPATNGTDLRLDGLAFRLTPAVKLFSLDQIPLPLNIFPSGYHV